jgi:hypothetical protein
VFVLGRFSQPPQSLIAICRAIAVYDEKKVKDFVREKTLKGNAQNPPSLNPCRQQNNNFPVCMLHMLHRTPPPKKIGFITK